MCHTDLYHNLVPITKRFLLSKTASSYFSVKAVKPFTGFELIALQQARNPFLSHPHQTSTNLISLSFHQLPFQLSVAQTKRKKSQWPIRAKDHFSKNQ